ncbi:MAG: hypothetical protein JNL11_02040 [Bdellovibrionaceae bacterium]|nr:hypothetical protein [Pseudobdellovibrionaceae bacterium]
MDTVGKKKQKHPDRITLIPAMLEKVSRWKEQLNESKPGVKASRADIVHWLLDSAPDLLSEADLKSLQDKFYDSVEHAKWVLKTATLAKARGESINIKIVEERNKTKDDKKDSVAKTKKTRKADVPLNPNEQFIGNLENGEEA